MKKYKQLKLFAHLLVIPGILSGCGSTTQKTESLPNEKIISALEENKDLSSMEEQNEEISYQGRIYNYRFLEKDNLFQLTLDSYDSNNYIYVDLNNEIIENPNLTSDYLETENVTEDTRVVGQTIYNLEGNDVASRFINDSDHEEIMGLRTIEENQDIVIVKEVQETPTDSYCAIKLYDEKGVLLCQTDSTNENYYLNSAHTPFQDLNRLKYVDWVGDTVLQFSDPNKSAIFSINVTTGELLPPNAVFSNGYAIAEADSKCIIDLHGNIVADLSDYNRFGYVFPISEDLFFDPAEKCFYDKTLQKQIDLSQYEHFSYTRDELSDRVSKAEDPTPFVFKDGYCKLTVCNSEDTDFYGIIDSNGNEVYPFSEESISYNGIIADGMLLLNGYNVYDIQTKSIIYAPNDILSPSFYEGKAYYVNSSNDFCTYDYTTQQLTQL